MAELRSKPGILRHDDGRVEHARFYYGENEEAPADRTRIDPSCYATWVDHDGAVGIRRGTSVSVGASAGYAQNYDAIDWGN